MILRYDQKTHGEFLAASIHSVQRDVGQQEYDPRFRCISSCWKRWSGTKFYTATCSESSRMFVYVLRARVMLYFDYILDLYFNKFWIRQ